MYDTYLNEQNESDQIGIDLDNFNIEEIVSSLMLRILYSLIIIIRYRNCERRTIRNEPI